MGGEVGEICQWVKSLSHKCDLSENLNHVKKGIVPLIWNSSVFPMFLHWQWRQEKPWKLSQQLASHKEEPLFQTRQKMRTNSQCCPPTPTHGLRCTVTHTQRHTHITHTHPKMIPIIHSIHLFCFFPFIYLLIYLFIQRCIQQTFPNMVCWANPTSSGTG